MELALPIINFMLIVAEMIFLIIKSLPLWLLIPLCIALLECVIDILMRDCLFDVFCDKISGYFYLKSFISIFTLGLARDIYLIYDLILIIPVCIYIGKKCKARLPLPFKCNFPNDKSNLIYKRLMMLLEKADRVISNEDVVQSEFDFSLGRINSSRPKKWLGRSMEKVFHKEKVEMREIEQRRAYNNYHSGKAYLGRSAYRKFAPRISKVMSEQNRCPIATIKRFNELSDLNLNEPLDGTQSSDWSTYFIIMALQPLVEAGIFEDNVVNQGNPLDNHAYVYRNNKNVIDLSNDPRFDF